MAGSIRPMLSSGGATSPEIPPKPVTTQFESVPVLGDRLVSLLRGSQLCEQTEVRARSILK